MADQPRRALPYCRGVQVAASVIGAATLVAVVGGILVEDHLEQRATAWVACRLPEGATVQDVEASGAAVLGLLLLVRDQLDAIFVEVSALPVGRAEMDATARFDGVALDADVPDSGRFRDGVVTLEADAEALRALTAWENSPSGSTMPGPRLTITDGVMSLRAYAGGTPLTVVMTPDVVGHAVRLTPDRARIRNRTFDPTMIGGLLADAARVKRGERGGDQAAPERRRL